MNLRQKLKCIKKEQKNLIKKKEKERDLKEVGVKTSLKLKAIKCDHHSLFFLSM